MLPFNLAGSLGRPLFGMGGKHVPSSPGPDKGSELRSLGDTEMRSGDTRGISLGFLSVQ